MAIDIRRPNINGQTDSQRLEQIRSYLYQVAEQLNFAFNTIETSTTTAVKQIEQAASASSSPEVAQRNFNAIKSLIVKSADVIDAYYEEISKRLEGYYVAQSAFGAYTEATTAIITQNSTNISTLFTDIQEIESELLEIGSRIETDAYIKSGILYYDAETGAAVYGLEIGQTNEVDGEEVFDKFARFTSDRLSFYDTNDIEVAYISDYKLYITNAEIKGTLTHGGYDIDSTDGLAYLWKGRS
jgi:dGTP triphosphohydrolase